MFHNHIVNKYSKGRRNILYFCIFEVEKLVNVVDTMKKCLLVIIGILMVQVAAAQWNCSFTHYSAEDGLSQNTIMSIMQDSKGGMWFATWDGINKFNGYTFKTYKAKQGNHISLTNNRVDRMYEDKYGYIWIFTYDNRAHRFDPRTEEFEQVPASGEGSSSNIMSIRVLANGTVWLLTESDGAIRVITDEKDHSLTTDLYSIKTGLFPALQVYKVAQDSEGNEWILTDNGLGMISPGEKTPVSYFVETKEIPSSEDQSFYSFEEHAGEIYFGSDKGRVWHFRRNGERFRLLELDTRSPVISINSVSRDMLVLTTDRDGFFLYNTETGESSHYSPARYKELSEVIVSTYMDKKGEIWFEQNRTPGLITHFNPFTRVIKSEQMEVEAHSASRSHPAFHVHEDANGYTWVHPYGGGFSYFDRENNRLVPFYNHPDSADWRFSNKIHSAFSDKQGNLWVCTHSKGLEKITFLSSAFNLDIPFPSEYESLSNEVRAICEDKEGNIWVGMKDELIRIYDKEYRYRGYLTATGQISYTGTPLKGVAYSIMQDKEDFIWIATKGDGLIRAQKRESGYDLIRFSYNRDDIYSLSNDDI